MGSFVAASVYLCFTLLYGRRMRSAREGEEEEGKEEGSTKETTDKEESKEEESTKEKTDEEEGKGEEIGVCSLSDKVNTSVPEVGGEGSRGT